MLRPEVCTLSSPSKVSAIPFTLLVVAQGVAVTVCEQSQVTIALDAKVETVAHIKETAHDVAVLVARQVLQNFFVTVRIFPFFISSQKLSYFPGGCIANCHNRM